MKLRVRFFATLKEKAQASELVLDVENDQLTVQELLAEIIHKIPALTESLKTMLVAVNNEFAFREQTIYVDDEIALFPPVSGG